MPLTITRAITVLRIVFNIFVFMSYQPLHSTTCMEAVLSYSPLQSDPMGAVLLHAPAILIEMEGQILVIVIVLVSVLISMTVHEAMHAFAGYALGDNTAKEEGRLTLNPIAHIDPIGTIAVPLFLAAIGAPIFGAAKPVPFNPENLKWGDFGAAIVALAGPFTNLALAVLGSVGLAFFGTDGTAGTILLYFILVNVGFFVFNMIPFPPLDGSRFLYAVAPEPVRALMRTIEGFGVGAIFLFIMIFFLFLREPFSLVLSTILNFLTGISLR